MAQTVFHAADTRGHANHGWLNAHHSFSFASWQNRDRIHFGALRVLNDDIVAPGMGFSEHPHDNMEIITIPLSGNLVHGDSMGSHGAILPGEVQVMSAGTGVYHSEKNGSHSEPLSLFQIWIFPETRNVKPRYDQRKFDPADRQDKLQTLVAPLDKLEGEALGIHQQAWIYRAGMTAGRTLDIPVKKAGNGVYVLVISGTITIGEQVLNQRDALGIWDTDSFTITAGTDADVLLLEVPMEF